MREIAEIKVGDEVLQVKDAIARHRFDDTISGQRINRSIVGNPMNNKYLAYSHGSLTVGRGCQAQCYFVHNGVEYKAELVLSHVDSEFYSGVSILNIININDNSKRSVKFTFYHGNSCVYRNGRLYIAAHGYRTSENAGYTAVNKIIEVSVDTLACSSYTQSNMSACYGVSYDDTDDTIYVVDLDYNVYVYSPNTHRVSEAFTINMPSPYNSYTFQDFSVSGRWVYILVVSNINLIVYDRVTKSYVTTIQFDQINSGYWMTGEPESIEVYSDGTFYIGTVARCEYVSINAYMINQLFRGNVFKNTNYYPAQLHRDAHSTLYVRAFTPGTTPAVNPTGSQNNPFDLIGEAIIRAESSPSEYVVIHIAGAHSFEHISISTCKHIRFIGDDANASIGGVYLAGGNVRFSSLHFLNCCSVDGYQYGCVQANGSQIVLNDCIFNTEASNTNMDSDNGAYLAACVGAISGAYQNTYSMAHDKRMYRLPSQGSISAEPNVLDDTQRTVQNALTYTVPKCYLTPFNTIRLTVGHSAQFARMDFPRGVQSSQTYVATTSTYIYEITITCDNRTDGTITIGGNMVRRTIADGSTSVYDLSDPAGAETRPYINSVAYI